MSSGYDLAWPCFCECLCHRRRTKQVHLTLCVHTSTFETGTSPVSSPDLTREAGCTGAPKGCQTSPSGTSCVSDKAEAAIRSGSDLYSLLLNLRSAQVCEFVVSRCGDHTRFNCLLPQSSARLKELMGSAVVPSSSAKECASVCYRVSNEPPIWPSA